MKTLSIVTANLIIIFLGSCVVPNTTGTALNVGSVFFYGFPFGVSWVPDTPWAENPWGVWNLRINLAIWIIVLTGAYLILFRMRIWRICYYSLLGLIVLCIVVSFCSSWTMTQTYLKILLLLFVLLILTCSGGCVVLLLRKLKSWCHARAFVGEDK